MSSTLSTADLERLLQAARAASLERSAPKASPIERADRKGRLPLSFAQQRLWFLEQLGGLGTTYHIRKRRRLRGALDRAALVRALDDVVARHETLRTTFAAVDGVPEQRIAPVEASRFHLVEHDLDGRADADAELARLAAEEASAPFDLERGPLVRGRLIRLAADDHVLLVTMHHIVTDAWSSELFFAEFSALYAAHREGREANLPALPVQYADYAVWQRKWLEGDVLRKQADYWTETLSGAPELLELPTDRPRPAQADPAGARLGMELDEEVTAGLKALSKRHGTTLFQTVLAGWAVVLGRLSGQDDVVIGTPTANRGRKEIEDLIGFFLNTLAVRVDLSGAPTVAELLARVKKRVLDAQQHQDIPFEQVIERVDPARSLAHHPLFQVLFAWQNTPRRDGGGLAALDVGGVGAGSGSVEAKFDLSLELLERAGRIRGGVTYAASLFARETVERWVGYLRRVLMQMAADDTRSIDRLALIPADERARLLEAWNRTEAAYPAECVHRLFERQAERTPDADAVVFAGRRITYAALNAAANRLAHHLREMGVGPDVRVAICAERGLEMVIGLLAVLKAGGAYVPLDPTHPADRLAYVLEDSRPLALLTNEALRGTLDGLFREAGVPVLALDADASAWADRPETNPVVAGLTADHLAYTIYTSGSTGRPKGVMNHHRGVVNLLLSLGRTVSIREGDRLLAVTTLSFDIAALEIHLPLLSGAAVHLLPDAAGADPAVLADAIDTAGATLMQATPATWRLLVDSGWRGREGLRALSGGEALPAELAARVAERVEALWNVYGPTETTIWSTVEEVAPASLEMAGHVAIGAPVANTRVYVLDAAGEPVPTGAVGELFIGGDGVARGYRGRPELTAERFVADSFAARPGARMYRTGDLARWRPDGRLEYRGRTDFQVKVRGFRIELGEIEARLADHSAVREAVVAARDDAAGGNRLVAYYVAADAVEVDALRAHLSRALPAYMVPAAYVWLERLPLTPNGKVDRKALPAPEGDAFAAREYEAPAGAVEEALAEVWAEVLRSDRVGRRDNFFELGGHSLLAVRVIARMRQRGLHAEVRTLFTAPTLAALAAEVGGGAREAAVPANAIPAGCERITPEMLPLVALEQPEIDAIVARVPGGAANVQDIYPLAPLQEGVLFHHLMAKEGDPYLLGSISSFESRDALDRYLGALQSVVDRHDILRTSVAWEGLAEPVQIVWRKAPLAVEEVEIDPAEGDAAERLYARFDPRHHRVDVRAAPLMRAHVARDEAGGRWLLLLLRHHLISDHTTGEVLQAEVEAHLSGRADSLPAPLPFRDHVARARLGVSADEHRAFFAEMLGDVDEPTAPFGLTDARGDGAGIEEARLRVDPRLAARLRERARALGVSAASVFHVAWARVLALASGREDVVFGTVLFGRMQGGEGADRVMGPFINTLPIRLRLGDAGAEASVRQAHALLAKLLRHEHASLALAQRCSAVDASAPLFTAMLNYRHSERKPRPTASPSTADARPVAGGMRRIHAEERSNYPLSLAVDDLGDAIALTARVKARVEAARVCALMHAALEGLVDALETAPERPVGGINVLPAEERARVLDAWNRTEAEYPRDSTLHALFEAQAARTPDAVAVTFETGALTYAGLNARANRLAHHLRAMGVGPDVMVGLSVERSLEMMVGLLAILKAGGAYVALDPSYPEDRLRYMLADSAPAVLLTQAALAERFAGAEMPVVALDADAESWADRPETNPADADLTPDHLAYVIYTSGSTGLPKGVAVAHRSVVNVLTWMQGAFGVGAGDAVLQKTPYSFDASLRELMPPLLAGARLVMARPGGHRDAEYMLETIRAERITTLHFVPTMLQVLVDEPGFRACTSLARVVCGGEALPRGLVERFHAAVPWARLHNVYGPTEAAVDVTWWSCAGERGGEGSIPIGRPMANTRLYVLDRAGRPVPAWVAGELYIGGVQVARGYLNRPALTAERFVPDPFGGEAGARLYRTGDLARWRADGAIDYLGRADHQVKVRGFRIELGEIEARLREHAGVREAVVVVREDGGDRRLVAYWVGEAAEVESLREHLGARLPSYMVPAAYVRLDQLPRTPNGKLDRRALPAPEGDAYAAAEYEAPETETERALAEIWAEVLRVERVGRHDHFFELGGHSLLAVQVISRVRQVLEVEVELGQVFTRPVLKEFAWEVETAARADLPPIERAPRDGGIPLSFAQQRLWFLEQMGNLGSTYHMRARQRLRGELDRVALGRALDVIVARHESLRTTFAEVDGVPEQCIAPASSSRFPLIEHDLVGRADAAAELARLTAEELRAPFDLHRGPLIRGRLVRLAEDDYVLLFTMHHIVSDGWSSGVLTRELRALYAAFRRGEPDPLPALEVQYADYALWQRKWVEGEVLREQADYWRQALAGAPELLELPTDRPRPAQMDHAGARLGMVLDEEVTAGLKALSRRHGTTLFMTLLAGWAVVLGRLSGQEDVVIGTPTANRGRREIEGLIGFFVNTLALRLDLSGSPTVAELLARVKARALGAQHHQDIPFEQVVELVDPVRSPAHHPLFQVTLTWQNTPREEGIAGPGGAGDEVEGGGRTTAKFDLSLSLSERNGRIRANATYATALFARETVERWVGYLRRVLEEMAADDGRAVDRLSLVPGIERTRLVEEWNRTALEYPREACLHQLFERQAEKTPGAEAVVFEGETLTYAELNARANRLAHHLRALGVGPDVRVGICVERSLELMVGLVAILKAGGAYVALDPELPEERLRSMLEDSRPAALLAHASLAGLFAAADVPVIAVDADADAWADRPPTNPEGVDVGPDHLVYVIYTSGSTGKPKGVMNAHRNVVNRIAGIQERWRLDVGESVLQNASLSFDVSAYELFWPLMRGARVVMTRPDGHRDPDYLVALIQRHGIGTASFVPSMLQLFLETPGVEGCATLVRIPCGGEALPAALARRQHERLPHATIYNRYGPSEAATCVTGPVRVTDETHAVVPIGRPMPNARIYLLDRAGEPVPAGVAGELYIGGDGVGRGYLDRPDLTAEKFVADPFSGEPGARLYRTGDRARWLADGTIEFLGRTDFQMKVRGFRIEPGEIEARLVEHAAVRDAVVVAREDGAGGKRLVAYCVADEAVEAETLRAHVARALPEYMVPAAFVLLERMPLTPSGKLDRGALPAPPDEAFARRGYEPPADETEEALAEIWADVLGIDRVGRWDNFFELGGHSLLGVRVISRVRQALDVDVQLSRLFTRPVLADLAQEIVDLQLAQVDPEEMERLLALMRESAG